MDRPVVSSASIPAEQRSIFSELAVRHGLWPVDSTVTPISHGAENQTYSVGGCVVRFSSDSEAVSREIGVLDSLAGRVPVATPVPLVRDPHARYIVYRMLPGEPVLTSAPPPLAQTVASLSELLAAVRRMPSAGSLPVDDFANHQWRDEAANHFAVVRPELDDDAATAIGDFLDAEPPSERGVYVAQHNDLGGEHILLGQGGVVSAVIDWTDTALADPARDLGLIFRDLGADIAFGVATALDGPPTVDERARIRFHARCKWLEDLRFALEDPRRRTAYRDACRRTFSHVFLEEK